MSSHLSRAIVPHRVYFPRFHILAPSLSRGSSTEEEFYERMRLAIFPRAEDHRKLKESGYLRAMTGAFWANHKGLPERTVLPYWE